MRNARAKAKISKREVTKIVKRIAHSFTNFPWHSLSEVERQDLVADWFEVLGEFEESHVKDATDSCLNEASKFPPGLNDIRKRTKHLADMGNSARFFRADSSWFLDHQRALKSQGLVICDWEDGSGRHIQQKPRARAIFNDETQTWWPKLEYCLKYLGSRLVTKEIEAITGKLGAGELVAFLSDPEKLKRYYHKIDVLVDAAQQSRLRSVTEAPF